MLDAERHRLDFLPGVAEKLGPYYVYALRDPRDGAVFYVGKGKGSRAYQHARHAKAGRGSLLDAKLSRIRSIHADGREVIVEIVRSGLSDGESAYEVEAAVIDALTRCTPAQLDNPIAGHGHTAHGWKPLEALRSLAAPPIDIPAGLRPCVLIRPNRLYRYEMTPEEMWEITRKSWKMARRDYRYAFCVYGGIIRGVWRVTGWGPESDWGPKGRRALVCEPAEDLWGHCVGGDVGHLLPPRGGQIPFTVLR